MKIFFVICITLVVILMFMIDWPKLKKQGKRKDKITFVTLSFMSWILAVLLLYFPKMPGPTQLVDWVFKPFAAILE